MERKTGVVLPLGALYSKECAAVGDFLALKPFADFCKEAGLSVIQLLPVNDTGTHSSPYSGLSAFALHPLYIRIESMPEFEEAKKNKAFATAYRAFKKQYVYQNRFAYTAIAEEKIRLLHLLYSAIEKRLFGKAKPTKENVNVVTAGAGQTEAQQFTAALDAFVQKNEWVIPYAVFKNLKDDFSQSSWKEWPQEKKTMTKRDIEIRWANKALRTSHNFFVWCQMRAAEQFADAAEYVRAKGIALKGDIPILMNEDSADCWANPAYFDQKWRAGSPPDGENPLGQNWGFPTYNWESLSKDGYVWWQSRIKEAAKYYDAFRIDHILGFFRIWAVDERETNAFLGHANPCCTFSRKELNDLGFDNERIKWLSVPHIPTKDVEDITWNHEEAHAILKKVGVQIGSEELWNFLPEICSDGDIYAKLFDADFTRDRAIKDVLAKKWRDRALLELKKDEFIAVWSYSASTAWKTLNEKEKKSLEELFSATNKKQEDLWKKSALSALTPIVQASGMQPCAEDLGVGLKSMPEVLSELDIFSLKVVRWTRDWFSQNQPYIPFSKYPELSVATTSVHDSSTLRQWWNEEKQSVNAYCETFFKTRKDAPNANAEFDVGVAEALLETSARCNSAWFINPLQDYLFLDAAYYLENPDDERVNVPGSVNEFNWTYRMPVLLEDLSKNTNIIEKIKRISTIHGTQNAEGEV